MIPRLPSSSSVMMMTMNSVQEEGLGASITEVERMEHDDVAVVQPPPPSPSLVKEVKPCAPVGRIVRIIWEDKDATDSSGDETDSGDDGEVCPRGRRVRQCVHEIRLNESPVLGKVKSKAKARVKKVVGEGPSTKFRGVRRRSSGRYAAEIRNPSKRTRSWLGTFDTAEEAARKYDAEAIKLHGAGAITNFKQPAVAAANASDAPLPAPPSKNGPSGRASYDSSEESSHAAASHTSVLQSFPPSAIPASEPAMKPPPQPVALPPSAIPSSVPAKKPPPQPVPLPPSAIPASERTKKPQPSPPQPVPPPPPARPQETAKAGCSFQLEDISGELDSIYGDLDDLINDFPELPALDFLSDNVLPELQLDDLGVGLWPTGWQQVDEFLNDVDFTDLEA